MNFWNKSSLTTQTRKEYASLLTELVELNEDKQWIEYFYNLKLGQDLPGGGMGSLNDWSPSYPDVKEYAWFNLLYGITHNLLTQKKEAEFIKDDFSIEHRNEVNILNCEHCNQKFQHPSIFENHIATFYYLRKFSKFVEQKRLVDFTNSNFSYNNIEAIELRESLESEYEKNDIILFDFIKQNHMCPKCNKKMDIEHTDYKLIENENKLEFSRK